MKPFIGVVFVATTLCINPPNAHAMFGHTAEERQRRIATEQQLSQEQQRLDVQQHLTAEEQHLTNRWQITAFVLGNATVLALIIGTAISSKARRDCES